MFVIGDQIELMYDPKYKRRKFLHAVILLILACGAVIYSFTPGEVYIRSHSYIVLLDGAALVVAIFRLMNVHHAQPWEPSWSAWP